MEGFSRQIGVGGGEGILSSVQGGLVGKVGKPANSPLDLKPEKSKSAGLNVY